MTSKQAFVQFIREEWGEIDAEYYSTGYMQGDCSRKDDEYIAFRWALKWLLSEAKKLAFPSNTQDQVIRLSDLEKLIGEE